MQHLVKSYPKFWWKSSNQHGIHSPFVYQLVTRCFYDKKEHPSYPILKQYRKNLLRDQRELNVTDLGAGSRVFNNEKRKVAQVAKNSATGLKRSKFLNRLTAYFQVRNAVELGTSVGMGSAAIACENPVNLYTIEGCPEIANVARNNFKKFGFNNIQLAQGDFTEKIAEIPFKQIDMAFIDGNHQKEATLSYFEKLLPYIHNNSFFILDDIYWSPEMQEAWETIKAYPQVKVSIDTFFWGLIFFRKEQRKEHFKVRL
ncbi:O-methyltransferase [Haloflavibacter putidus]|uniref:Class I SAM-dependent methyltransferase n=1 Tax=Haloflavibacter putidus TaxID=2576776 RepID=A0A507ZBJ0_9FLAO|nr:class I SAM-dependent methyltransferase [Haloflavibacter putidus]TQD33793.1 class I SAM-dependent methyltransferase [Haloflavibacter putidus]